MCVWGGGGGEGEGVLLLWTFVPSDIIMANLCIGNKFSILPRHVTLTLFI